MLQPGFFYTGCMRSTILHRANKRHHTPVRKFRRICGYFKLHPKIHELRGRGLWRKSTWTRKKTNKGMGLTFSCFTSLIQCTVDRCIQTAFIMCFILSWHSTFQHLSVTHSHLNYFCNTVYHASGLHNAPLSLWPTCVGLPNVPPLHEVTGLSEWGYIWRAARLKRWCHWLLSVAMAFAFL